MITGIDISHFNTLPESGFHGLFSAGVKFVILKSTQGIGYTDPTFVKRAGDLTHALKSGDKGVPMAAAYHFGTGDAALQQAEHFLATVKPYPGLVLALDWETNPQGATMGRLGAETFVQIVKSRTGKFPVLYCSRSWPGEHDVKPGYRGVLLNCPLWLADYSHPTPHVPAPFKSAILHQFSDQGHIGGMTGVDLDRFAGDEAALRAFWQAHAVG